MEKTEARKLIDASERLETRFSIQYLQTLLHSQPWSVEIENDIKLRIDELNWVLSCEGGNTMVLKFTGDTADLPTWQNAWRNLKLFTLTGDVWALDRALLNARASYDDALYGCIRRIVLVLDNAQRVEMARDLIKNQDTTVHENGPSQASILLNRKN